MLEFNVKNHILFPTYVWEAQITGVDNESILEYIHNKENQDPAGVRRSNVGGWHSHPYELGDIPPECFQELIKDKTTRSMGLFGLIKMKLTEGNTSLALKLTERLIKLKPRNLSFNKTFFSWTPNAAERLNAVVVFPTPPFWLDTEIILPIIILFQCVTYHH